ncbi:MAG: hypothetical protein KAJ19_09260, partial [Gammaproteobacteria bacterium]|nr:hypothetical protein [Gammaproteobacteria bacterium]
MTNLRDIKSERHKASALDIHPYFGRVDPALAKLLVSAFSQPGDTVLDPFCGSGTVLHTAILSGRSAVGWDSSPLATLISSAKLTGITAEERVQMRAIARHFEPYSSRLPLLQYPL